MPKLRILFSALLLSLSLSVSAQQIYHSTDSEGNSTFSDKPAPESEAIVIESPNIADPVAVPPPSTTPPPAAEPEPLPEVTPVQEGEIVSEPKKSRDKKKRKKNKKKWKRHHAVPHY